MNQSPLGVLVLAKYACQAIERESLQASVATGGIRRARFKQVFD